MSSNSFFFFFFGGGDDDISPLSSLMHAASPCPLFATGIGLNSAL